MGRLRAKAIMTTSQPIEAYGGFQLPDETLYEFAEKLRSDQLRFFKNHDPRQPWDAVVVNAGVEDRDDGYKQVWAEFDVDEDDWEQWQHHLEASGAPGGMSFSLLETLETFGDGAPLVTLAADPSHFDQEIIVDAARRLADIGTSHAGVYFQFAHQPDPVIVFILVMEAVRSVGVGVVANYLYEALKSIRKSRKSGLGQPTIFDFTLEKEGARFIEARLESTSDEVLKHAIDAFTRLAEEGVYDFDHQRRRWTRLNRPKDS